LVRFRDCKVMHSRVRSLFSHNTYGHKLFWIKTTQQAYYSSEFKILQAAKRLKESHALLRLTAIIDHAGILRVGGRLQNSQLDADSKHPAILPKESQPAQLIISHAHSRTMHGGTQLTLSLIRKSCWIVPTGLL
jgi:hypothetical protein